MDPNVNRCWGHLRKVSDSDDAREPNTDATGKRHDRVNWHDFLLACREVARFESARTGTVIPAFDLSLISPESFSCSVLETASEMSGRIRLNLLREVRERNWGGHRHKIGLLEWLDEGPDFSNKYSAWKQGEKIKFQGHWLTLYKTWLMLGETLDLSSLVDPSNPFEFRHREPNVSAVATRQWYKTASATVNLYSASDPPVCTQLPGKYSVRGDWFLAVSKNSRSLRLAHRAIDILGSRRANITRLQMGVGLPVRDILPTDGNEPYRTCLFKPGPDGEGRTVSYEDLLYIGGGPSSPHLRWVVAQQFKRLMTGST